MADRSAKVRALLAVPCDTCGVRAGQDCQVHTGQRRRHGGHLSGKFHVSRQAAAAEALMKAAADAS
jgi:hypothetical protein